MKWIGIEDPIPQDLHKILKKVRRNIIKENGSSLDCCFDASHMIYQAYHKINRKIKMVRGSVYEDAWHLGEHVWIEIDNYIADITADQFGIIKHYQFRAVVYVKKNELASIYRSSP